MPAADPTPDASIITPARGDAPSLEATAASVRDQQGAVCEHVVVPAGDMPHGAQLAQGLKSAHGRAVLWLESGDRLAPDAAAAALSALDAGAEVAYGAARRLDGPTGETVGIGHTRVRPSVVETILEVDRFCAPATWWRSDVARSLGGPRPELEEAALHDLWVRNLVRSGQGRVTKTDALLAEEQAAGAGRSAAGSSRRKQELHSMWLDLFTALEAPAEMRSYCEALTPYHLPRADWQPGDSFPRNDLLAAFCEKVVRLYYYDGAYDSARAWLARANDLGGRNWSRLRLAAKLAMKK